MIDQFMYIFAPAALAYLVMGRPTVKHLTTHQERGQVFATSIVVNFIVINVIHYGVYGYF